VKWLVNEAFSEEAASLLDNRTTLIAPERLFAEAANGLWALCRRGDIGWRGAEFRASRDSVGAFGYRGGSALRARSDVCIVRLARG
jgi:hypothetical protein